MGTQPETLQAADRRCLWHPFTPMNEWMNGEPLIIASGEGNWLIDTEGRRYLDAISSLWVTLHGHNHPRLNQAIRDQLDRVAHSTLLGLSNVPAIEFAERLLAVAPTGLSRVFYSDSGSTAVEIALKIAFQYWQLRGVPAKRRFLHLAQSYHGDTLGAVAVGGIPLFHQIFGPILVETLSVGSPHRYRHPAGTDPDAVRAHALDQLATTLEARGHEIAAFILEPLIQGAAGILEHPPGYLAGAAALCRKHDVLLITDEVATGFGRTGNLFACEHEDVRPDILCLAKGISGGYLPLAATLTTEAVFETFLGAAPERRTFFHGHTYTGNPLACAVGIASLELFSSEPVIPRARERATQLRTLLDRTLGHRPWCGDIRGRGLMIGIELVADRDSAAAFPVERRVGAKVCLEARRRGVILRPLGDVLVVMPPLSITAAEVELLVDVLDQSIAAVLG